MRTRDKVPPGAWLRRRISRLVRPFEESLRLLGDRCEVRTKALRRLGEKLAALAGAERRIADEDRAGERHAGSFAAAGQQFLRKRKQRLEAERIGAAKADPGATAFGYGLPEAGDISSIGCGFAHAQARPQLSFRLVGSEHRGLARSGQRRRPL
jgi:hypothetical protein